MNAALSEDAMDRYLYPGELIVSRQSVRVSSVLGSCVSVCLWDFSRSIGGVNHFLLPRTVSSNHVSSRYGDPAIPMLLEAMCEAGAQTETIVAKVFGGACLVGAPFVGSLGAENVAMAFETLTALRIPIVAEDTGGSRGRRLLFMTDDGTALVRKL